MKIIKYGEYIRIEADEDTNIVDLLRYIQEHVRGIADIYTSCDECRYVVNGVEYKQKAKAILAQLNFGEHYYQQINIIFCADKFTYSISSSSIENDNGDGHDKDTDLIMKTGKTVYEIIEILVDRPYIHRTDKMSWELQSAFGLLSEAIIQAKKENSKIFMLEK